MSFIDLTLKNLELCFPDNFDLELKAQAKTIFFQRLSYEFHKFYRGKIQVIPKAGIYGFNWFNIWYTPGVSSVSTHIRDDQALSFDLTNRGNQVAIVSDSTRVLGDGDCTPSGGLGVMEGKALLMKYLGGIDAFPLCIDSKNDQGINDPDKIINFVKMVQPSFGAVNLEDISQPNCYTVLEALQKSCSIPVWHDDAQGTASVTLAGLLNSLKLTERKIDRIKTVLIGAGASNTAIARFCFTAGMDPENTFIFDAKGALHKDREDLRINPADYKKWELCQKTNPKKIQEIETAIDSADVLIALSRPGPDTVKPVWIKKMNHKPIVFACANPVPEIYPDTAKEAGAYIVATGRGDFPNQINNSLGFPGILKGVLIVKARAITDTMAIAAAKSLAGYAEEKGITPERIIPDMDETGLFFKEAADVAVQAIKENLSDSTLTHEQVYKIAEKDIQSAQKLMKDLMSQNYIEKPELKIIEEAFHWAINQVKPD